MPIAYALQVTFVWYIDDAAHTARGVGDVTIGSELA